jgi:hypothetical protein
MEQPRNEPLYSEWVLPNWTSFLPILAIYPTAWATFVPFDVNLGIVVGIALTLLVPVLMVAKSSKVAVFEDSLRVANAQIDRKFIVRSEVIGPDQAFAERGRDLDSRAFIHFQGSVKTLIKVYLNDPEDPTPYWLFSTRKPEQLKKVLAV